MDIELVLNTLRTSTYFGREVGLNTNWADANQRGRVLANQTIRKDVSPDLTNHGEVVGYLERCLVQGSRQSGS